MAERRSPSGQPHAGSTPALKLHVGGGADGESERLRAELAAAAPAPGDVSSLTENEREPRVRDEAAGSRTSAPLSSAKSTRWGDAVFRTVSTGAGTAVLVIMAAIAAFLVFQAVPALTANQGSFFTDTTWQPDGTPSMFGIAALTFHTIVTSIIAMAIAVPIAIGVSLFLTFYAPRAVAKPFGFLVDLLSAVPSVVFGLWGLFFLAPSLTGVVQFLDRILGWTIVFQYRPDSMPANQSDFTAGLVLAIMILPTVSAISREVFSQVPTGHVESALALGATRWEMIKLAVIPFSRGGMVSAAMLGLGRALGETLAVTTVLSTAYAINVHILEDGGVTFASNIALKYNEAGPIGSGALIASGLALFVITLAVNSVSQLILRRQQKR